MARLVNNLSSKQVLIIDDMASMRAQLQMSLTHAGFEKMHIVASIREALVRMGENDYDVILCDYFLGDSTNGQQFLEYLRTKNLISRNTLFIMITAESTYEHVVTAAECKPDDYLLKPFTAELLSQRLNRLLERQDRFAAIDRAFDAKEWSAVIEGCDMLLVARDRHFVDLCRIKGEALLHAELAQEAAQLYREVIRLRPLPWAKLGLARALSSIGHQEEAVSLAQAVIAETPQFMAAYDFLGQTLTRLGDKQQALQVLQQARQVSPGTMNRNREICTLAVDTGQHALAEQVMSNVLEQHKFSPVREAGDYTLLSRSLVEQGKTDKALQVLQQAKGTFKDDASKAMLAAGECVAHIKAGDPGKAEAVLAQALNAGAGTLPPSVVASVADACFQLGHEARATALLKQLVQNHPDDATVHARVKTVFAAAGKQEDEANAMIALSTQEVVQLNNEGVRMAQAGRLAEAVTLLCEAAERLPNNLRIVGNAALALALDQASYGLEEAKMRDCMRYRQALAQQAPQDPKLEQIDATLKKVKRN